MIRSLNDQHQPVDNPDNSKGLQKLHNVENHDKGVAEILSLEVVTVLNDVDVFLLAVVLLNFQEFTHVMVTCLAGQDYF